MLRGGSEKHGNVLQTIKLAKAARFYNYFTMEKSLLVIGREDKLVNAETFSDEISSTAIERVSAIADIHSCTY